MEFADNVSKCLRNIKNGNLNEFETLYQMTFYHLFGIARIYLKDKSLAEDVVIDAYSKVYMYIDTYKEGENGYNWMCKIVQNSAFYHNNITNKNTDLINTLTESFSVSGESHLHVETKLDLFDAIEKLDPETKKLIYSYFFYGKKLKEIAEEYHLSPPGAKKRIDNAIKKLRKFYKQ